MRKKSKIVLLFLVVAVLILGIGYAAIENITLNILGTAKGATFQENFTVKFSGKPIVQKVDVKQPDLATINASVTNDNNAALNILGLTAKGDTITATYVIQNTSDDLSAELSARISNSNPEYFDITHSFESQIIENGEATKITVTVELIKTPITESEISTVGIQIVAEPIQ